MPRVAIGVCSRRKRQIRAAGGRQSCELYSLRSDAGHFFSEYSVTGVHRSLSRSRRRLCNHSSVEEYAQLHRSCAKSDTVQRSACYSSCQLFQPAKALTELRIRAILRITPRKRRSAQDQGCAWMVGDTSLCRVFASNPYGPPQKTSKGRIAGNRPQSTRSTSTWNSSEYRSTRVCPQAYTLPTTRPETRTRVKEEVN